MELEHTILVNDDKLEFVKAHCIKEKYGFEITNKYEEKTFTEVKITNITSSLIYYLGELTGMYNAN